MDILTLVRLDDVNGQPVALLSGLPSPLRIGDPLTLRFRLTRNTGGRHEVLDVSGQFRVSRVAFDATTAPSKQLLSVEAATKPPTWRSVKPGAQRALLAPAVNPRTPVAQ